MTPVQLGSTEVHALAIGMSTSQYAGGPEALRRGVELGAGLIDTAELYGTEAVVGEAISGIRDRVVVATKVSPENLRPEDVRTAADRSLEALRIDYIDLYQIHSPNESIPIAETMGAMEDLVDAGKVRFVGVSNFSLGELRRAQAAMTRHKIVSNQVPYNLINRGIEHGLLSYCRAEDVTVIAYRPLAGGMQTIVHRDRGGELVRVAEELRRTPAQVALNWCVAGGGVIAIPKANSVSRIGTLPPRTSS